VCFGRVYLIVDTSANAGDRSLDVGDQCLLSATLIIGRLCWLFKVRGDFLERSLEHLRSPSSNTSISTSTAAVSANHSGSSGSSRSGSGFKIDEDQLRSAFEIADTNGDGVLSYLEVLEVEMGLFRTMFFIFIVLGNSHCLSTIFLCFPVIGPSRSHCTRLHQYHKIWRRFFGCHCEVGSLLRSLLQPYADLDVRGICADLRVQPAQ
jgi:hypothetical protein